ncbi:MAG: sulfatase [Planctomycetota bacterium]|nr:sulfatase [Planctomycetota bacterium]
MLRSMFFVAALCSGLVAQQADPRPNVVVIVTDDQRDDQLGCVGHEFLQTPALDALAERSVRFSNAFVTTAICAASRASILTGAWEGTHGYTFGTPPLSAESTDRAWPQLLRDAGYRTGFVGKWGVRTQPGVAKKMWNSFQPMRAPYLKKQPDGSVRHLTEMAAERAVGFLRKAAAGKEPFCLMLCFNAPHAEDPNKLQYIPPPDLADLYADVTVPPPPLASPEFFASLPEFQQKSMNRKRWFWRFDTEAKYQKMVKNYWAMITGIDQAVARVVAELDALGEADNTVVVFTSDNGYFLGERGFAGKWTIHEPSIRVPLLVCDPRLDPSRRGVVADQVALNVDLAPTILDLVGLAGAEDYQGASLLPLLEGQPPTDWRQDFFYEHRFDNREIAKSEGVRGRRWVFSRYYEQQPVYEELYDLVADPLQQDNLAGSPDHAGQLARMRARCDELREQYVAR